MDEILVIMTAAFKRSLAEDIGSLGMKPDIELEAWRLALLELAAEIQQKQAITQELRKNNQAATEQGG